MIWSGSVMFRVIPGIHLLIGVLFITQQLQPQRHLHTCQSIQPFNTYSIYLQLKLTPLEHSERKTAVNGNFILMKLNLRYSYHLISNDLLVSKREKEKKEVEKSMK